jgi:hypothetical protein
MHRVFCAKRTVVTNNEMDTVMVSTADVPRHGEKT